MKIADSYLHMDMSKVKRSLLRSGVPLEASVIKKLAELGVTDWNEVVYERNDKTFSTDIEISKRYDLSRNSGIIVNFTIECKYKEKNHCWFFMKFQEGPYSFLKGPLNAVFGDLIDPTLEKMGYQPEDKHLSWGHFMITNLFDAKAADKGVDIQTQGGKFDPNTITRAVSQAIHGAITVHGVGIENVSVSIVRKFHQQKPHSYSSIGFMTVPIIVTTAKLFRVKDNTLMEDIENANNILDLSKEERSVLLFNSRSNFRRFSEEKFKKENIEYFYKAINYLGDPSIGEHPSFRYNFPRNVYILNYDHLDDLLSFCLEKLQRLSDEIVGGYEDLTD